MKNYFLYLMKLRIQLFSLSLILVSISNIILAQTPDSDFKWVDGYLEKYYSESCAVNEVDGIPGMFDKCVAVNTIILGKDSAGFITGYIRVNGVGDSKGNWRNGLTNWSGVGTFANLNVPDGGILVYVKIKGNTIGFKVGNGDRQSSEVLHNILADRIKKRLESK